MSESRPFWKEEIRYIGMFVFKDFFNLMFNFMTSNGYIIDDDSHAQKEGDTGVEVETLWKFWRKIDDYTKFRVEIYYWIQDMKEVIIKKEDGREVKTNEGNIYIRIKGEIETDWQGRWEVTPMMKKLRGFYERYLLKPVIDDYIVKMSIFIATFAGELKSFFNMIH